MANIKSAKKRARQAIGRRARNVTHRSRMRTYIKKVLTLVAAGDKQGAQTAYEVAAPQIDRMAGKGLIHRNKAARHKSRLSASIQGLS